MNANEKLVVEAAINILENELKATGETFSEPRIMRDFLRLKFELLEHEVFAVLFLNNQHQLIEYREMFRGTIDGAGVYPREVAKEALALNAAAVAFAHNHPSGVAEPSQADVSITKRLVEALALLDIRTLDHFVIGRGEYTSMAERGLL